MRQRNDVYSMPKSKVDSGLHLIAQHQTTIFVTVAIQYGFENNPKKMTPTR